MSARLLDIWPTGTAPFRNALEFTYGLGSTLGPLIAAKWLATRDDISNSNTSPTSSVYSNQTYNFNNSIGIYQQSTDSSKSNIYIPYSILSGVTFWISVCYFCFHFFGKQDFNKNKESFDGKSHVFESRKQVLQFLTFTFLFFVISASSECSLGDLLPAFGVVGEFHFSKETAAYLSSTYWSCVAVSRFVGIFTAIVVSPLHMLAGHVAICAIGCVLLVVAVQVNVIGCIWAGVAIAGYGIGPLVPW